MKAKSIQFKKKLLAASVSSCVLASLGVQAQDGPTAVEEVQVVGMRASLVSAMNTKRDAVGVVDAITSEDIGKMPDTNLAESLQRIAGLSISRTNGEGAQVTVRGIDPSMNMVTLNGRTMPSVTNNGTAGNKSSRAFDFANIASEGVSGVEVYKTGKANVAGGGLGASINLKTLRPLDLGETKGTIGLKAVQDTTVYRGDGEELTPEVSGLYSWVNEEESFGVALTASYQERDNSRASAFVNNWTLITAGAPTASTYDGTIQTTYTDVDGSTQTTDVDNQPAVGSFYGMPTDLRYAVEDNHRERTNTQLTVQFRPIESLTATLDYTYSQNDLTADRAQQSTWYNNTSRVSHLEFDTGKTIATPIVYEETYPLNGNGSGKDTSFAHQLFSSVSTNNSFGINLDWDVSDSFNLSLDYHDSAAKNVTEQIEVGLNANVTVGEYSNWGYDLPVMGITIDDSRADKGNNNGILDGGDVSSAMGSVAFDIQDASVKQLKLEGVFDISDEMSVKFGYDSREDNHFDYQNNGTGPRITMGNWGGVDPDSFGSVWPSYFDTRAFGDAFPDQGATTSHQEFLTMGLDADIIPVIDTLEAMYDLAQTRVRVNEDDPLTTDVVETYYWATQLDVNGEHSQYRDNNINPENFNSFPNGKVQNNGYFQTNRVISEDVTAFYAQFQGAFEIGGMESNVVVGVRQEKTDVDSVSVVTPPSALSWDSDNDHTTVPGTVTINYAEKNSYDNLLPNVDFDISPTDELKLRASYSETMARPSFDNLRSEFSIGSIYSRTASTGNPQLDAMESKNIDLSAEYYYTDDSYVSLTYFTKDVSNFIGSSVVNGPDPYGLKDIRSPNSTRYAQALAYIATNSLDGNDEVILHRETMRADGQDVSGDPRSVITNDTDAPMEWAVATVSNNRDATVDGFELSVQHWFGDSGFGVQANYTDVNSDLSYDNTITTEQFAMIGLSDTMNVVGFYDKDGLQARIAYNWRDEYLASTTQGGGNTPGYVEAYSQIDFNVSYDISDNVTLLAEGLNITGEDSRLFGRTEAQMYQMEDLGARYNVGVRIDF